MLSLNKSAIESPMSMRGRPLPATPSYQQNGLPMYYTPIKENESPPAPAPSGSLQRLSDYGRDGAISPASSVGLSPKVPPKPPPKPKSKITGPLFEDEGEDGTEV